MNSSTRCELGASILAAAAPVTAHVGIDNAAVVLKGMQIIQVNGIPVYDKKGVQAAIGRGDAHETHFEFQRVGYGSNASLSTGLRDTTRQFDEEAVGGNASLRFDISFF